MVFMSDENVFPRGNFNLSYLNINTHLVTYHWNGLFTKKRLLKKFLQHLWPKGILTLTGYYFRRD